MYEMYPEWGHALLEDEYHPLPTGWSSPVQESLDLRDHGGERPDEH